MKKGRWGEGHFPVPISPFPVEGGEGCTAHVRGTAVLLLPSLHLLLPSASRLELSPPHLHGFTLQLVLAEAETGMLQACSK